MYFILYNTYTHNIIDIAVMRSPSTDSTLTTNQYTHNNINLNRAAAVTII